MIQEKVIVPKSCDNTAFLFSILIPSWNNLQYLQLCIESIKKNSCYRHQIVVHVNEGIDGSLEWVKLQEGLDYSFSATNIGVCYALNTAATLAVTDYILYLNDDMYVCPNWDKDLYDEIKTIGHNNFFISGTSIEAYPQSACSIKGDFGKDIESFQEEKLLAEYDKLPMQDWQGATWPPNVVHKDVWDTVGGYSIEFSPGMYSDPDFSMKLWKMGIRLFKGVSKSRVYHFGSTSVKRVKKNNGYYTFINKWGLTSGTFSRYYLKRGKLYDGPLMELAIPFPIRIKNLLKRVRGTF
jgi:glycosyltransferase involved in cell wall biosynthesis